MYQEIAFSYQTRISGPAAKRYCAITYELYLCIFYAIVEVKSCIRRPLSRHIRLSLAKVASRLAFEERKATMAKKRKNYYGFVRKINDIG